MVKITKSGSQYRITIPSEIIVATKWDEETELIFAPFTKDPNEIITNSTPIMLKEVGLKQSKK